MKPLSVSVLLIALAAGCSSSDDGGNNTPLNDPDSGLVVETDAGSDGAGEPATDGSDVEAPGGAGGG